MYSDFTQSQSFNLVSQGIEKGDNEGETTPVSCILDVVTSHDQSFGNYVWLHPYYGTLLWIDFEEPIGSGNWRTYDRYYWSRHAGAIDHNPDKLYEEHVKAFVDPETKFINLLFWFQKPDGSVYSMPPNEHFYQLEAEYFSRWQLCDVSAELKEHEDTPGPEPEYCQNKLKNGD